MVRWKIVSRLDKNFIQILTLFNMYSSWDSNSDERFRRPTCIHYITGANWTVVDSIPTSYNLQLYINIFTKFIALLLISYCLYISVLMNRFSPQYLGPPLLSFATHGEQDSNPRCSFEYSFGDCRLRPLGHLRK